MLKFKTYSTIFDEDIKKDWLYLQDGLDMTAFQHYDWYCMLEKEFKSNFFIKISGRICYLEILDDDVPIAIAPLHIQKKSIAFKNFGYKKGVYFLGMKGYSDYLNFIYRELNSQQISFLIKSIFSVSGLKKIRLAGVPESSALSLALNSGGIDEQVSCVFEEPCVSLKVKETSDDFFKGMKKQFRQNYRTQKHHYEKDGIELTYKLYKGTFNDVETLNRIKEIHEDRFEQKNKDNLSMKIYRIKNKFVGSFDEISYAMKNNQESWVLLGFINGKLVSYIYGLQDKQALRIMQLGFDRKYAKYSPGIMILIDCILDNFNEYSQKVVDFTRGDESYKFRMGGVEHLIKSYEIIR